MQSYEYRVVPAPRRPKKVKGAKSSHERLAVSLTETINAAASDGWEYVRSDTLPMDEKKGMLSSSTEVYHSFLVFRRAKASAESFPLADRSRERVVPEPPAVPRPAPPEPRLRFTPGGRQDPGEV